MYRIPHIHGIRLLDKALWIRLLDKALWIAKLVLLVGGFLCYQRSHKGDWEL
jgi:hypothetical protein